MKFRKTLFVYMALFSTLAFSYGSYYGFPKTWDFDALTVGGSTVVTQATVPTPRGAQGYMTVAQSVGASLITQLDLNGEHYDTDTIFDPITDRFTVPAGVTKVAISAMFQFDTQSTGTNRILYIYRNGAQLSQAIAPRPSMPNSAATTVGVYETLVLPRTVLTVTGGDYFDFRFFQDSPIAINTRYFYGLMEVVE